MGDTNKEKREQAKKKKEGAAQIKRLRELLKKLNKLVKKIEKKLGHGGGVPPEPTDPGFAPETVDEFVRKVEDALP